MCYIEQESELQFERGSAAGFELLRYCGYKPIR